VNSHAVGAGGLAQISRFWPFSAPLRDRPLSAPAGTLTGRQWLGRPG